MRTARSEDLDAALERRQRELGITDEDIARARAAGAGPFPAAF
jgi:hypothetical protein